MKRIVSMIAAIAMIAGVSTAQAADHAWFTLEGATGPGAGSVQVISQGPGNALIIEKVGDVSLNIGFRFTNTFNAGMASWAIALQSSAPGIFSNPVYTGTGYAVNVPPAGVGTPSLTGSQFTTSVPGGAAGLVYRFDLGLAGEPIGNIVNVTGDFGGQNMYYGEDSGYAWYGFVGPNPISYGINNYTGADDVTPGWGQLPVIIVRNVPEPASIALLGLGAVALLRRRK